MSVPNEAVKAAQMAGLGRWQNKATVEAMLEAAAPHMLAGVTALAEDWEKRGESDMEFSKSIPDPDIAIEILTNGAQMVENARHIRNALEAADPTVTGTEPIG